MLYKKNNNLSTVDYYKSPEGLLYKLLEMSNVYDNAFKVQFDAELKLKKIVPIEESEHFHILILDFFANVQTNELMNIIENFKDYFDRAGFNSEYTLTPLQFKVTDLTIKNLLDFIDDKAFQQINNNPNRIIASSWIVL